MVEQSIDDLPYLDEMNHFVQSQVACSSHRKGCSLTP